jgi:threonine ammonia-lyase medium form
VTPSRPGDAPPVVTAEDVRAAALRVRGVVHRTPVLTSRTLDERVGASVFLKAENLQRGGAFKIRGAYNRVATLPEGQRRRGVVAFSSGNHAQGVALAAREFGIPAVIVMPEDAPEEKAAATRGYGATVVTYDRYHDDREAIARDLAGERGLAVVPPYDDPFVVAGQGTVGLELCEQVPDLDVLVSPIGGGGLIGGSGTMSKALRPGIRVVGVEPDEGDDTRRSLDAGHRVAVPVPRTIADGLAVAIPGELTFEVNLRVVDEVVTVTDDELIDAMSFLFERMKTVVEPSGAAAVAALLAGRIEGRRVGAILSGGNVGADRFRQLLAR